MPRLLLLPLFLIWDSHFSPTRSWGCIASSTPYMGKLIPTLWPSKHMYQTSLMYAWIWTLSYCKDVGFDEARVIDILTLGFQLQPWCLSTTSNMHRYLNINLRFHPHLSLSKLDLVLFSWGLSSAMKKSLGIESSCLNDVACCKIELVFHT
jgi:hypothetical protein